MVPTQEVKQSLEVSVIPLTPKSASLTTPFLFSRMFAGFMSLCTKCLSWCKYDRPCKICTVIRPIIGSGIWPTFLRMLARDPASMNSNAMLT